MRRFRLQESLLQGCAHARIPKILNYLSTCSDKIQQSKSHFLVHGITIAGCLTTPMKVSRAGSS